MGIVKTHASLENFLSEKNIEWQKLNDKEYRDLIKNWRAAFEDSLLSGMVNKGSKGVQLLEERFPFDGYIFNCPNYRYLPLTKNSELGGYSFGYRVCALLQLDRDYFNRQDFLICDLGYRFMCAFNHEAPNWIPEIYCEAAYE